MGAHLVDGEFQSDKYPTCPRGKVPLSVKDPAAQDLLWQYAQRHRAIDAEFSDDLEAALLTAGYKHDASPAKIDLHRPAEITSNGHQVSVDGKTVALKQPKPHELEDVARSIAGGLEQVLLDKIGHRVGFMLYVFDFGQNANLAYMSNARREECVATVKEWLRKVGAS